jgi:proline dehydrogenase
MLPPLASRFVAGESAAAALERARQLGEDDVGTILNLLGEHYHDRASADADTETYCRLLSDIATTDLRIALSVKPTQLGLAVGESVFRENLARILDRAKETGSAVWLDMEDHTTTDATLDAFEHHARSGHRIGVCVQANLRRTREDLERLAGLSGTVRLVKGAYNPPASIAIQNSEAIDAAYREHLEYMFREFDGGVAVGSHDPAMHAAAATLQETYGTDYEIQMLMGVRESAQRDLARQRDVWQYVPYGNKWLSYFYRRVTENVDNAAFVLRALRSG